MFQARAARRIVLPSTANGRELGSQVSCMDWNWGRRGFGFTHLEFYGDSERSKSNN